MYRRIPGRSRPPDRVADHVAVELAMSRIVRVAGRYVLASAGPVRSASLPVSPINQEVSHGRKSAMGSSQESG